MAILGKKLDLARCPHCRIDRPHLQLNQEFATNDYANTHTRHWATYWCDRCGGVVLAGREKHSSEVSEVYPQIVRVDDELPDRAKTYLEQAYDSLNAPAGSIMLSASAIDAMLKEKGYKEGSLYQRIDKAASDNIITDEMAIWAHEVRLDSNEQRHSDHDASLATTKDAKRTLEFTSALGTFLYSLPAKVQRGIRQARTEDPEGS